MSSDHLPPRSRPGDDDADDRPTTERRPTRAETRLRLLEGAAEVFADKGISAATIEQICAAAGFSRGAFYSNFKAKDELGLALLEDQLTTNLAEMDRLFDVSTDTESFIQSMESEQRQRTDPIKDNALLYIELVLYALRNPKNRPRLVERQRRSYDQAKQILAKIETDIGVPYPGDLGDMAAVVLAFDDGLLLHRLIDPESVRDGQYSDTMLALHRLWVGADRPKDQPDR